MPGLSVHVRFRCRGQCRRLNRPVVATTGGHQLFVKEILGEAFDSQAEHFLRGNVGVDGEAIRSEAFVVNGKARMYFGAFPALVRIPLHVIYPPGRGMWSRLSGFCGGIVALVAMAGLLKEGLAKSAFSPATRNWLGNVCLAGFAVGSPLLFLLGNVSIYNEPIIWGLAWSLAAVYFAYQSLRAGEGALTRSLLGFSGCAAAALLSRVTFGLPMLFIALILAFHLPDKRRLSSLGERPWAFGQMRSLTRREGRHRMPTEAANRHARRDGQ